MEETYMIGWEKRDGLRTQNLKTHEENVEAAKSNLTKQNLFSVGEIHDGGNDISIRSF